MKTKLPILIACLVAPLVLFAQDATLLTAFTNPAPVAGGFFGDSVAAVGTDRVLIGASGNNIGATKAGAAYLFSTHGALLTVFTNPTPAVADAFGASVAALESDRVLIGARGHDDPEIEFDDDVGAAYLFNTNGTLLTTFANPTPMRLDFFGNPVAAVGTDLVLIGAVGDDTGAKDAGAAYLFDTNGGLITTFTNPVPATNSSFGYSLAAVGSDRVLIGGGGRVHLFSLNGTLITTFTNPITGGTGGFGSVTAVGTDLVLIGVPGAGTGTPNDGTAYLLSTNGILLSTFTNPRPKTNDFFGSFVVGMGTDRVLIVAPGSASDKTNTGGAYLFSTNGTLLNTFIKPTPATNSYFSFSAVAVGTDRVLIGAFTDSIGARTTGAAYLFLIQPAIMIGRTIANTVAISWPSAWMGFTLQENTNGVSTADWINVSDNIQDDGINRSMTVPAFMTVPRFYRLEK